MYVRLCETLNNVGRLVPTAEIAKFIENQEKDYYSSIFLYNEDQKRKAEEVIEVTKDGKTIKRPKGVSGIKEVVTNKLVFDFDSDKLQDAKLDTIVLINRLESHGVNSQDLNICFSGSKGFSVELNTKERFSPEEFKGIVHALALDLKTFDPKIVDPNRIFRLPFTKHPKTGLYKTPLSKDELEGLSIDEIKDLAKNPIKVDAQYLSHTTEVPESIKKLKTLKKQEVVSTTESTFDLDLTTKPSWLSNWKYALSRGFFKEGTRSYALTILAATCRKEGFPKEHAKYFLFAASEEQAKRYNCKPFDQYEIEKNIIEVVYGANWQGGSWAEDNFPEDLKAHLVKCNIPREGTTSDKGLESVTDIYSVFANYAENIDANTIKTGIPGLDDIVRITTSMMVGVLGSPASGKTATVLNILKNMSESGEASVFFSLDMGKPLVFQKMVQQLTGFSSDYLYKIYQDKDEVKKEFIKKTIESHYKNVQLCFKTGASVDDLKKYIVDYENYTGKKVRMVAVDYLEKVVGPYSDATANSGYVAAKLQELANDLQLCVIVLLQPQKAVGVPSDPILSYRNIKGASIIEQDCRVVISLWREGYNPQNQDGDKFITYAVLKNSMGQLGHVECGWDGLRGAIYELDDSEKVELEEIKKRKAELKIKEEW